MVVNMDDIDILSGIDDPTVDIDLDLDDLDLVRFHWQLFKPIYLCFKITWIELFSWLKFQVFNQRHAWSVWDMKI